MKKMDDASFDKKMKKKLGEYNAPDFDPEALALLHHQMAARLTVPW